MKILEFLSALRDLSNHEWFRDSLGRIRCNYKAGAIGAYDPLLVVAVEMFDMRLSPQGTFFGIAKTSGL